MDSHALLPIQPRPLISEVLSLPFPGGHVATMVCRTWRHGDTALCRLCPDCTANHERAVCSVLVDQPVAPESAAGFSARLLTTVGPDAATPARDPRAQRA